MRTHITNLLKGITSLVAIVILGLFGFLISSQTTLKQTESQTENVIDDIKNENQIIDQQSKDESYQEYKVETYTSV